MTENFVGHVDVWEAACSLGLVLGDSGVIDAETVVGMMSGLDMTRHELEPAPNLHGWFIRKRNG